MDSMVTPMVIINTNLIITVIRIRLVANPVTVIRQTGRLILQPVPTAWWPPNPIIPRLKISITRVVEVSGRVPYPVLFEKRVRALNTGNTFSHKMKLNFVNVFCTSSKNLENGILFVKEITITLARGC